MDSQEKVQASAAVTRAANDSLPPGFAPHRQRFNIPSRTLVEASLGAIMSFPQSWPAEDTHSPGFQEPVELLASLQT